MENHGEQVDFHYEAQCNQAALEAEQEQKYQEFLDSLIKEGQYTLFAAYVSCDWLKSLEFRNSKLSALEYMRQIRDKIEDNSQEKF